MGSVGVGGGASSQQYCVTGGASSQQYCLKWNNHQNNMLRVFMRLLGSEQFTDVTLAAEGKRIKCHKMVLSACSSYFEHLFLTYNENNQIVILKDTSYTDIAAIVEFMYKGEINVSQDHLSSLLKTAENLKVKGLAEVSGEERRSSGPGAVSSEAAPASSNSTRQGPGVTLAHRLTGTGPPPMQMMGRPQLNAKSPVVLRHPGTNNINMEGIQNIMSPNGLDRIGDIKRKRGRPRTLDGPGDDNSCFSPRIESITGAGSPTLTSLLHLPLATPLTQTTPLSTPPSIQPKPSLPMTPMTPMSCSTPGPASGPVNNSNSNTVVTPTKTITPATTANLSQMTPLQSALSMPVHESSIKAHVVGGSTSPSLPVSACSTPAPGDMAEDSRGSFSDMMMDGGETNGGAGGFIPPLTPEKVASWGIIKMNDYLVSGTRQQYWEEYFVKHVMSAVRNKEIDMKGAAELLGVSYGTLYGRYRETFGYLKHAWNVSGRPQKKSNLWTDPNTRQILESMRSGSINIKQAAEALGMEPAMLAYQLAGKVQGEGDLEDGSPSKMLCFEGFNGIDDDIAENDDDLLDYNQELMEVQPDIIMEGSPEAFDSYVTEENDDEDEGVDPIAEVGVDPTVS